MKFSATTAVLSTLAASQLAAAGVHSRQPKHNHAARHVEHMKKQAEEHIEARDVNMLLASGVTALGFNPTALDTSNPKPWIGTNGPYTNTFYNRGDTPATLVIWANGQSWVNKYQPLITLSIATNASKTVSFADGMSGAWAAVYGPFDLTKSWGQIAETWGEYTFASPWTTVDVSREVNMQGSNMKIITPNCVSSMTQCVFMCQDRSALSCETGYELVNCKSDASNPGAGTGQDWGLGGAASGGCSNIPSGSKLLTFLGGDDSS